MIDCWGISCELAIRWISRELTDEKSGSGISLVSLDHCRHIASLGHKYVDNAFHAINCVWLFMFFMDGNIMLF